MGLSTLAVGVVPSSAARPTWISQQGSSITGSRLTAATKSSPPRLSYRNLSSAGQLMARSLTVPQCPTQHTHVAPGSCTSSPALPSLPRRHPRISASSSSLTDSSSSRICQHPSTLTGTQGRPTHPHIPRAPRAGFGWRTSSGTGTHSHRVVARSWSSASGGSSGGGGKLNITETDKLSADVRDRVLKAVEQLGGRVTLGDVAAKAGLKLSDADKALNALAADANGFLEVSDEGDVLWVFPKDMRAVLAQKSLRVRLAPVVKKAQDVGSYVVRVSFGTALLVSIAVVYLAIAALLSGARSEDNRDRGGGGFRGGPSFFFNVSDIFWYWDPFYYQRLRTRLERQEMSFIESVFSFVFGDGDPNEGLDEARWKAVGELISRKGGVVAAQELAPYLDIPKDFQETEAYMLPVLQRFDGVPEVDEQGNILYKFPSLQRTAQDWSGRPKVLMGDSAVPSSKTGISGLFGREEGSYDAGMGGSLFGRAAAAATPAAQQGRQQQGLLYFAKNLWEFSGAPSYKQMLAAGLGVVNLVGVLYLSYLVRDPMIVRQVGSDFVTGVVSFLPWLQAYASVFFAIPALRWLNNQRRNEKILEENERREESAILLSKPNATLRRKLLNAREQAESVVLNQERIIYNTAQDIGDQDLEAREWERKIGATRELEERR